jgi:hypothetical protein
MHLVHLEFVAKGHQHRPSYAKGPTQCPGYDSWDLFTDDPHWVVEACFAAVRVHLGDVGAFRRPPGLTFNACVYWLVPSWGAFNTSP